MNTLQILTSPARRVGTWDLAKRTGLVTWAFSVCVAIFFLALGTPRAFAQGVGISETSISPDPSAILELSHTSGSWKGFLVPRMSTANRTGIGSPATGLLVYDTDVKAFFYNDGGWIGLPGGNSVLGIANGGTGISSYTIGDMLYASGATTLSKLLGVAAGSYLRSGGVATAPVWSTLTLPNGATTGDLFFASGANTMGNLADVAVGRVLVSGGVGVAPAYSATPALGVAGSTLGTLSFSGNTSGTVTMQPQAAAGTYNFNLPTTAGTSGQPLLSGGGAAAAMTFGTLGIGAGGTGQTTALAAFNALSPLTTLGDVLYGGASGSGTRLVGNTTTARMALTQTGTGAVSAAPAWVPVGHSGVTVLTGSGNYNVPADVTVIVVELVGGGGGGGGGVAANAGTVSAAGGGGGGGAYTRRRIATSGGTGYSYVVGTGGSGAGAGVGTAGGQTQFNTAAITANGGSGGTNMTSGTAVTTVAGGAGGTAGATGDVNIPGGAGGRGFRGSGTIAISGTGGGSQYGSTTTCVYAAVSALTNGTAGSLYGSGGSGGAAQRTAGGPFTGTGGNGSNGTIIVWEFK